MGCGRRPYRPARISQQLRGKRRLQIRTSHNKVAQPVEMLRQYQATAVRRTCNIADIAKRSCGIFEPRVFAARAEIPIVNTPVLVKTDGIGRHLQLRRGLAIGSHLGTPAVPVAVVHD